MKLYFAGPLFSAAERHFNARLTERLEGTGFEVFLPQRDGAESDKPPYDLMPKEARRQAMFRLDEENILAARVFLFVLDGRVPDEGACVELGIAHAQRKLMNVPKLLIGLQTDVRAAFLGAKLNPMLNVFLDYVTDSESELLSILTRYADTGRLP